MAMTEKEKKQVALKIQALENEIATLKKHMLDFSKLVLVKVELYEADFKRINQKLEKLTD